MSNADFLLDTNMLGYLTEAKWGRDKPHVRNVQDRVTQATNQNGRRLFIAAITAGECECGLRMARRADLAQQALAREVLRSFPAVLSIDNSIAVDHYAGIRAKLFERYAPKTARETAKNSCVEQWIDPVTGKTLGVDENDLWIVATAMAHNLTLVTNDRLKRIIEAVDPPIRIENWTEPAPLTVSHDVLAFR